MTETWQAMSHSNNAISFGQWLKVQREELDLSRSELARRANCSISTVRKVEVDERRPSRQVAGLLLDALGVPPEERDVILSLARARTQGQEYIAGIRQGPGTTERVDSASRERPGRSRAANIPFQLNPFVGRTQELRVIDALLARPDVRLLTIVGPPGVGKTRFSLQAALTCAGFEDGVHYVPLATTRDPNLIYQCIARALNLQGDADQPLACLLFEALAEKDTLLVLDNFEQIISGAPAVSALLNAAPKVKALVTSRIPLDVYGEYKISLSTLDLPETNPESFESLKRYDAVSLFCERAVAADVNFALTAENAGDVVRICIKTEGLPLAIELAAAQTAHLPLATLLERLGNRLDTLAGGPADYPERQRALRNAVDWSYQLLSEDEQRLFRFVALFVGDCDLAALHSVVSRVGPLRPHQISVSEGLELLRKKSLLQSETGAGSPRFSMLESIRELALEYLLASDEALAAQVAFADYYVEFARRAEEEIYGPGETLWLSKLEAEHDNLKAALLWLEETGPKEQLLQLAGSLALFWCMNCYWHEARERLARLLAHPQAQEPDIGRAILLQRLGAILLRQDDYPAALPLYRESLEISRTQEDRKQVVFALLGMGVIAIDVGDYSAARAYLEEGLILAPEHFDPRVRSIVLHNLGVVSWYEGDLERAQEILEEELRLVLKSGGKSDIFYVVIVLGEILYARGAYNDAQKLLAEAQARAEELDNNWYKCVVYQTLGGLALALCRYDDALEQYKRSFEACKELGNDESLANCLEGAAAVYVALEEYAYGIYLYGAATALCAKTNSTRPLFHEQRRDRSMQVACSALGEDAWNEALAKGLASDIRNEEIRW